MSDVKAGAFLSTMGVYDIYARKLAIAATKLVNATVRGWKPSGPGSIHDSVPGEVEFEVKFEGKAMFREEAIFGCGADIPHYCF